MKGAVVRMMIVWQFHSVAAKIQLIFIFTEFFSTFEDYLTESRQYMGISLLNLRNESNCKCW